MAEIEYIQRTKETAVIAARIIERFAGNVDDTLANLAANGIVFGNICPKPEEPEKAETNEVATEQPKEWVEHQEQERRAWAISTAVETLRHATSWDQNALVSLAKEIETYVKGSNPDQNDVNATDQFYIVMGEKLMGEEQITEENLEEFLIGCLDELAKQGVRLKDGVVLEVEA